MLDADLKHLQRFPVLHTIILDLSHMTGEGIRHLHALPRIHTVIVNAPHATDSVLLESMPFLRSLKKLTDLRLRGSSVSDASIDAIGSLDHLDSLNVTATQISPGGDTRLKSLLPDTTKVLSN